MALVQYQGSPVALVGFAGAVRPTYGKMVILEVVTALENLAVMESLRQEADIYRSLFNRCQGAVVVATEKGRISTATMAGRTLLSRAENGERGALLKKSEQVVATEISSAISFGEVIELNGVTITGSHLGDPELIEPVIVYQLRDSQPYNAVGVEEAAQRLTPMQTEVLRLLLRGLQYKEIASHLGNSSNTVHHHVSEILRRLSCADRVELLTKFQVSVESTNTQREKRSVSTLSQVQFIEDIPRTSKKCYRVPENGTRNTVAS